MHTDWMQPEWPAPAAVGAVMTTRKGGVSINPFDTMNLGLRVGDDTSAVAHNRDGLAEALRAEPVFLHQVHGTRVLRLDAADPGRRLHDDVEADAAYTMQPGLACVVQVADCMPLLLASGDGRVVGAAHAGWRGLAAGVVEHTVQAMCADAGCAPRDLHAWMGPCIGPNHFEVGADVLDAFPEHGRHFREAPRADGSMRWLADLPAIARARLSALGVESIAGGVWCTVAEPLRFYSYRRDRTTGRHAAAVWLR